MICILFKNLINSIKIIVNLDLQWCVLLLNIDILANYFNIITYTNGPII